MNDQNDQNEGEPNQRQDAVRLVRREDAEAAIRSGRAITRSGSTGGATSDEVRKSSEVPSFPTSAATDDVNMRPRLADRIVKPVVITQTEDGEQVLDLRTADRSSFMPEDVESPDLEGDDEISPEELTLLPHWTEPATGEVPAVLMDASDEPVESAPRWRNHVNAWSQSESVSFSDLGDASGLGESPAADRAEDEVESAAPSLFDSSMSVRDSEETEMDNESKPSRDSGSTEAKGAEAKQGTRFRNPESDDGSTKSRVAALRSASMAKRVGTAVAFAIAGFAAFAAGPAWTLALSAAIVLTASVELFDAMRRVGYRPATLLALVAVAGAILGSYARGEGALALMLVLTVVFTFLWFLVGAGKGQPTANAAITVFGFAWTGILGSYAALLLRLPEHHGLAFLIGAILVTVAYDTGAYLGGSVIGRTPLAPAISPNKTWEGLAVGTAAAVVVGAVVVQAIHPWSIGSGILLGLVVSCVAPLGDLAESMIKRDLGLKDMGRILPGHGGILDRFDAMLFVLPATYYLVRMLNIG